MLASLFNSSDWWNFLADVAVVGGAIWGFVAGLSMFYHKYQMHELGEKITPLFVEINRRLDSQDVILRDVQHEVTFNNGGSVKDAVGRVEMNQIEDRKSRGTMSDLVQKIDRDLTKHLGYHEGIAENERRLVP